MGLFFPSDPVIHGQRATGLPRYQELLERDWKSFLFADFVTLGLCIPYGLGVGYALLSSSLLVLLPVCVVGGLLVGPAISCLMDALFRSYRDAPRGWWENYCKGMKQNWKASLLPGVVFSLALGIELFFGMVLFSGEGMPGIGTMAVFLAGLLILLMLFTAFWPQVVLFEESNLHRLQNAVLFCLKYGKHVLGAAALQLVWWLLFVLFLPWTGFLVPFLGVWFIWFVCFFLLYNDFNAAYGIEEKISQQFPEQKKSRVNPPPVVFQIILPQHSVFRQHCFFLLRRYQIGNPIVPVPFVCQIHALPPPFLYDYDLLYIVCFAITPCHTLQSFCQSGSAPVHITPKWYCQVPIRF